MVMVGSPGPASLLLLSIGAKYKLKNSFFFLMGVICSKQLIIWPVGFGLLSIFNFSQNVRSFFYLLSIVYFLFLIYKFSFFKLSEYGKEISKSSFFYGLIIHPINPKAWIMVIACFSTFTDTELNIFQNTLYISIIFFIIQLIFHSMWCYLGSVISVFILNTKYERPFFLTFSLFTILCLIFLLY